MRDVLLATYGEIFLKGMNRPFFLNLLLTRAREAVRPYGGRVSLRDSRILVEGAQDPEACALRLARVFGINSVSPALKMDKEDFGRICDAAAGLMEGLRGTFKVAARRSDKRYPLDSPEICARAGAHILKARPDLRVDVRTPEHTLNIEIRDSAFLYVRRIPGAGGMPVGSNGKAALLLSGGIDSPVAGYMTAKRGVSLLGVHFHSFPYTGERALAKAADLAALLARWACGMRLYVVPFTPVQTRIHDACPPGYGTLVMRRSMVRIASRIALKEGALALVTGESVGQVASQTLEALACTDAVAELPVLRPLIGFDKTEIIERARAIGSYDISILPYEDCCTVFTPRHPVTRPSLEQAARAEAAAAGLADLEEAAVREARLTVFAADGRALPGRGA